MTQIELLHRLKEQTATARYIAATPGYKEQQLDSALEEIEHFAQALINLREDENGKEN